MLNAGDPKIAIFDGDNTLWDTNEVFAHAQRTILCRLRELGYPADPDRDFGLLREVDDLLIRCFGRREYESAVLPLCLMRIFSGHSVGDDRAVRQVLETRSEREYSIAQDLASEFVKGIMTVPRLFPGVIDGLTALRARGRTALILYSEGREQRVKRIVEYHMLNGYFHDVFVGDKSLEDWERIRQRSVDAFIRTFPPQQEEELRFYVIGDLLERDIKPGNSIGAMTIYKPGPYKGLEVPRGRDETPSVIARSMEEVVRAII